MTRSATWLLAALALGQPSFAGRAPATPTLRPPVQVGPGAAETVSEIKGSVVKPDGSPAAGVRVFIAGQMPGVNGDSLVLTTTAAGKFHHKFKTPQPHNIPVAVSAFAGELFGVETPMLGQPGELSVKLRPAVQLRGKLIDPAGKPLAGKTLSAVIGASVSDPRRGEIRAPIGVDLVPARESEQLFHGTTDAEGRFVIKNLPEWGVASLKVRPDCRLTPGSEMPVDLAYGPRDAGLLVAMQPGTLILRAVDPAGRPAPNVQVVVIPDGPLGALVGFGPQRPPFQQQTTNEKGLFREEELLPGRYTAWVQGKEYPVTVGAGKTADVTVRAIIGPLRGRVVDSAGKPVAQVPISMTFPAPLVNPFTVSFGGAVPEMEMGRSNAKGEFALPNFPWFSDKARIRAQSGSAAAEWASRGTPSSQPVVLRLQPGRLVTVTGRLLTPEKKPVKAVQVTAIRWQDTPRLAWFSNAHQVQLMDGGRFKVQGLRRGEPFSILAGSPFGGGGDEESFETPRFVTSTAGAVQDLGDVVVHPLDGGDQILQIYGIESREALGRLSALTGASSPALVDGAKEALARYEAALSRADLTELRRMSSHFSLGMETPERFGQFSTLRPLGEPTLRQTRPMRLIPRVALAYVVALSQGSFPLAGGFNLGNAARQSEKEPEWLAFASAADGRVQIDALMHREDGAWKRVHLPLGPNFGDILLLDSRSGPDAEGFNTPAPLPDEAGRKQALATARTFLERWAAGDHAAMLPLTSLRATFNAPELPAYRKALARRIDEGRAPLSPHAEIRLELLHDLTRWETERLASYLQFFTEIGGSRQSNALPDETFPKAWVQRGDLIAFRYHAAQRTYLIVMGRKDGAWQVLEPALPYD